MATGISRNGELDWHSNMNGDMDRARGVVSQGALFSENTIQHLWTQQKHTQIYPMI